MAPREIAAQTKHSILTSTSDPTGGASETENVILPKPPQPFCHRNLLFWNWDLRVDLPLRGPKLSKSYRSVRLYLSGLIVLQGCSEMDKGA